MTSQGMRMFERGGRADGPLLILHEQDLVALEPSDDRPVVVSSALLASVRSLQPDLLRTAPRVRVVADPRPDAAAMGAFAHPVPPLGRLAKRVIDIVSAVVLLVATAPVLLVAVIAVRTTSPGPVLFRQERVGRDGKRFTMLKVRTMTTGNDDTEHRAYVARLIAGEAEASNGTFKMTDDRRITRVGRILRRTSIDELPQLWNVLRGDMSLVGPRPPLPHEVDLYDDVAWQRLRVEPGLTGLWQVSGRCDLTFDEMVALDIEYWQRWTLRSDLKIMIRTPAVVLGGRGAA